jgi:arylamine N-acetyltransferase
LFGFFNNKKKRVHQAPWLTIKNEAILAGFLRRTGIGLGRHSDRFVNVMAGAVAEAVAEAFKLVPYENLTKILKASSVISAASAMRYPDEVIGDYLTWGTGGTCFSLTASMVAVYDALGFEVYPVLADRHYGVDTHCGLVLVTPEGKTVLLDPGYLLCTPVTVPTESPVFMDTGYNRIELRPAGNGRLELYTIVKTNRKLRLTFKMGSVSDEMFGNAWERSFAFEMMTYPVLTRQYRGCHQYLQGTTLAVRNSRRTERTVLTPEQQIEFISGQMGIHREIAKRALGEVNYGKSAIAAIG